MPLRGKFGTDMSKSAAASLSISYFCTIIFMQTPSIDIILPCYNPVEGWELELAEHILSLSRSLNELDLHFIIVNDGSENTLSEPFSSLSQQFDNLQIISYEQNRGKGFALKTGLAAAQHQYACYTDLDFPYTIASMQEMIQRLLDEQEDIIVGTRDESYYKNIPRQRRLISKSLKQLNQFLFRLPTSDTQGGLKAVNQKAKTLFVELKTDRYLIDLEFLKKAKKAKLNIGLMPVQLRPDTVLGSKNWGLLLRELKDYLRLLFS